MADDVPTIDVTEFAQRLAHLTLSIDADQR